MIQGVIFDMGATLFHFEADREAVFEQSLDALVEALLRMGLSLDAPAFRAAFSSAMRAYLRQRLADHREEPAINLLRRVLADFGHAEVPEPSLREALKAMYAVSEAHWHPDPEAEPVLSALEAEGYRLGAITNAMDADNVRRLLAKAGWQGRFRPLLISAEEGIRKPAPGLFEAVLETWGLPPASVVMVGDTLGEDILGAQRVGLHQIWLAREAGRPDNQAWAGKVEPEATAERLADVPRLIAQLGGESGC